MGQPVANNITAIRQRIKAAADSGRRSVDDIRLIAVSKGKHANDVRAALDVGQKIFGENYVQEAEEKFLPVRAAHPNLELHLIGPLQTNKAEGAVRLFDVIQTLDRPRLAEALAKAIVKTGHAVEMYIQINIGNEPQKAGIAPDALGEFLDFCRKACKLNIIGLMGIPPQGEDANPYFRRMKILADQHKLPHLSMGMSADFEDAIRCGATEVRVGTAIFGERS